MAEPEAEAEAASTQARTYDGARAGRPVQVSPWLSRYVLRPLFAKARCYACGRKTFYADIPCIECVEATSEDGEDLPELFARAPAKERHPA